MEIGRIVKLKWLMNHNVYIGTVHKINGPFLSFREPCIVIRDYSGDIVPLHGIIKINNSFCEEEKIKEDDLFLLWKEVDKSYSKNKKDFEELVFKEMEKYKKK